MSQIFDNQDVKHTRVTLNYVIVINQMIDNSANNKRIAKNTIYLYIRTLVVMCVTLFTSRVILQSLGVEDFGIYNVVGGIIAMFGFITNTLSTSSQRFITFELGKGALGNTNKVFSTCFILHFLLALIIAIIAEPTGVWFVQNKLLIPAEKLDSAMWVYQFTVVSMFLTFLAVPFNALIVAHERMNVFALISIVDAFLKLAIAFAIAYYPHNKLVLYGALLMCIQITNFLFYFAYCKWSFVESKVRLIWDKSLITEIGKFASWSIFGNVAYITYTQGLNLLLGTFFLPAVNAARGVAVQVQSAVNNFVHSFQTAINPQITKNYASGNTAEMLNLVFRSSRFSYYLLIIVTIPLLLESETVLQLWLKTVPEYTVTFLRIILLTTWINSLANPLIISVKATGNVRKYESTVGVLMMAILPVSYVFLKLGFPPVTVFLVHLCFECIAMVCRVLITRELIRFSLRKYFSDVILKVIWVTLAAVVLPVIINIYVDQSISRFLIVSTVSVVCTFISIVTLGLTTGERQFLISKAKQILKR